MNPNEAAFNRALDEAIEHCRQANHLRKVTWMLGKRMQWLSEKQIKGLFDERSDKI